MTPEEERRALAEKAEELSRTRAETERRLAAMPYSEQTAQLRATMEELVSQLHRMERNLEAMLRLAGEETTEGGTENGSY